MYIARFLPGIKLNVKYGSWEHHMPPSLVLQDAGPFETFISIIIRMLGWAEGLYMTSNDVCRCEELQLSFPLLLCH